MAMPKAFQTLILSNWTSSWHPYYNWFWSH